MRRDSVRKIYALVLYFVKHFVKVFIIFFYNFDNKTVKKFVDFIMKLFGGGYILALVIKHLHAHKLEIDLRLESGGRHSII